MKNLTLSNIIAATHGEYHGPADILDRVIAAVTTDSRAVAAGAFFAAIPGEKVDGHDFIQMAADAGALAALAQRVPEGCTLPVIVVKNTIEALGDLAAFYRRQFDVPVLGVTGSVGKTTAKEMLASVLSQRFKVHKTAKNLNNDLGVPLTLFGLEETTEFAVVEMGISHFGEMTRLAQIVAPDMALYTVIGSAHLEFLGDYDGVLRAKTELLPLLPPDGTVFLNGDDPALRKVKCAQTICRYGMAEDCDVRAENIRLLGSEGMALDIVSGDRRIPAKINAYGVHMVTAALSAAAVGMKMGLTDAEIAAGIAAYVPVGSRSGIVQTDCLTIIDDCYNANPTSTVSALDSLALLPGRHVCILGDMKELGKNEKQLHFDTGAHAVKTGCALVVTCGPLAQEIAAGASASLGEAAVWFADRTSLISVLPKLLQKGDAVLVKASHSMAFEEIVEALKGLSL